MVFHSCRYYFVSPYTHQPNRIESVNIGLSPHTVSRAEITQADVACGQNSLRTAGSRVMKSIAQKKIASCTAAQRAERTEASGSRMIWC